MHTPCDVPVGSYECHIRVPVSKNKSKGESVWEDSKQVVFLFNPWNKGNVDQLLLCSCLQSLLWLYDSLSNCQYVRVITVDVVEELCNLHIESLELVLKAIIHLYWYYMYPPLQMMMCIFLMTRKETSTLTMRLV